MASQTDRRPSVEARVMAVYSSDEYKAEELKLDLVRLKERLSYTGPDPVLQEQKIVALGRLIGYEPYPFHRRIIRHQNVTHFGPREDDLTMAARGTGKSCYGAIVRAIAYVLDNPDVRILFCSDTAAAASAMMDEVTAHLQHNKSLVAVYGKFFDPKNPPGGQEATILQRKNQTIKEATFTALGVGGQGASRHFDVIFADDLVTLEKSRTPQQRKNLSDWYGSTLMGTKLPGTKIHHIGTRYYPEDQWERLMEGEADTGGVGPLAYSTLSIPLVIMDESGAWIDTTHPERFDLAYCRNVLQRMGRYHFNAQMQQDTRSGEGIVFNYSDFMWWSEELNPPPDSRYGVMFNYTDLVAKKTDTGDFHATVTITVARGDDGAFSIWVRDLVRERAGMTRQRNIILDQCEKWRPVQHGVEAVQMQAGFAEEIRDRTLLPVIPCEVETDKVFRARRVASLVEQHRVFFPLPETPAGRVIRPLVDELSRFPDAEHDDCVDAFVGALTLAMHGNHFQGVGDGLAGDKFESLGLA